MLVGFSGASSSGKTTLIKEISKRIPCKIVPECVRIVFKRWKERGFQTLEEIREKHTEIFQMEVLQAQIEQENKLLTQDTSIVLCDRTIYDILYYMLIHGTNISKIKQAIDIIKQREKEIKYDIIFVCEPLRFEPDGFRPKNETIERPIQDFIIRRLIPKHIDTIVLPATDLNTRVNIVINTLEQRIKTSGYKNKIFTSTRGSSVW